MNTAIRAGNEKVFLPAAGHDLFLPLYDPLTQVIGADRARALLIDQAALKHGQRVLDIGCGTGTLTIQLKRSTPGVEIAGVDPDLRHWSGRSEKHGVRQFRCNLTGALRIRSRMERVNSM